MRRYPLSVWHQEEIVVLLARCGDSRTGRRNAALLSVLAGTAVRIGEALSIELADLDFQRGVLQVRRAKGGKHRTVGIGDTALRYLQRWLEVRGITPGPIFTTRSGAPLLPSHVRRLLPRLASRAGFEKRLHAHALRRSLAYRLHRKAVPLAVVQKMLGHSTVAITSLYIDDCGSAEVVDAMRAAEVA